MAVKPIPDGYHTVTPYLCCKGAAEAIDFYKKAFGAVELMRFVCGDKVGHAEIRIGDSPVMLGDECLEMDARSPEALGGSPVGICLYVEDADAVYHQALAAGATVARPIQDQFYGDRSGTVVDPFGHKWTLATHKEDVSMEEMRRRMEAMMAATPLARPGLRPGCLCWRGCGLTIRAMASVSPRICRVPRSTRRAAVVGPRHRYDG